MARKHNIPVTNGNTAVKPVEDNASATILHMDDGLRDQLPGIPADPKDDPDLQAVYNHADEYYNQLDGFSSKVEDLTAEEENLDRQIAEFRARKIRIAAAKKEIKEKEAKAEAEAEKKAKVRRQMVSDLAEGVKLYGENLDRLAEEITAMQEAFEQLVEFADKVLADP